MEPTRYLKGISHLGINKYHSPSYHRINNSDDIYDYLYGNVGVSGKHSLPFHQAVNSIDNAGEKMYKRNFNYKNMLRFDKKYNLDDRILDYANDRLMSEWKNIDGYFQQAQQAYELGNITENKFNRLSKKYERNAERYNGYINNLNNNARHFNIANSINDGRSVVTGKGPLYDSMTKGIWNLIGAGIGAGFAPVILPKVISTTPWIMRNIALPYLGGEVINDVTRKASYNKYNSFGDFVYHNTPLSRLNDGTDSNIFVKGFSEMLNPAYLFHGKLFVGAEDFGNFYRPKRNQWGYTFKEPLINDATINRKIFPKMTNSPYIEINKMPKLVSNAIRIKNMKMGYTGVPGNFEENFPKYTGRIWLTDNIDLANHFAIRPPKPKGKIFKVFYEPAKNNVASAPKYDHLVHWKYLPYDFVDNRFITNSNFNINNIKFKTENIPIIKNNTVNTADDVVNKVFNSDYNILELPNIYEGVSMGFINSKPTYFNTLKNTDIILKENTPHVILPINKNKWSLLFKDIDKLLVK